MGEGSTSPPNPDTRVSNGYAEVYLQIHLPSSLFLTVFCRFKCTGNLYFGLKHVVTTIAPPAPEEAPSPLFCSPPIGLLLHEPEIRSWGRVENIFSRRKPETQGRTVPNGGRWRRPSLPGCKSDFLHSPLIWHVRYEYFSWRKYWHLVKAVSPQNGWNV